MFQDLTFVMQDPLVKPLQELGQGLFVFYAVIETKKVKFVPSGIIVDMY